jgi:hypothetical protein
MPPGLARIPARAVGLAARAGLRTRSGADRRCGSRFGFRLCAAITEILRSQRISCAFGAGRSWWPGRTFTASRYRGWQGTRAVDTKRYLCDLRISVISGHNAEVQPALPCRQPTARNAPTANQPVAGRSATNSMPSYRAANGMSCRGSRSRHPVGKYRRCGLWFGFSLHAEITEILRSQRSLSCAFGAARSRWPGKLSPQAVALDAKGTRRGRETLSLRSQNLGLLCA